MLCTSCDIELEESPILLAIPVYGGGGSGAIFTVSTCPDCQLAHLLVATPAKLVEAHERAMAPKIYLPNA